MDIGIEIDNLGGGRGSIGYLNYTSASYNKSETASFNIVPTLYAARAADTTVTVYFQGGHSDKEDYGVGKHYTITETEDSVASTLISYNLTKVTAVIPAEATTVNIPVTIVNNLVLDIDREILVYGAGLGASKTITIVDDNVDYEIDVTSPGTAVEELAAYPITAGGSAATNKTNFNAIMAYIKTSLPGDNVVLYFPAGVYTFGINDGNWLKLATNTNKISIIGPRSCYGNVTSGVAYLKSSTPYVGTNRLFNNQDSGYQYSSEDDSAVGQLAFINLYMDGDNQNSGTYLGGEFEQSPVLYVDAENTTAGHLKWHMEGVHIANSTTGGFSQRYRSKSFIYHFSASDCLKGWMVCSAGLSVVTARDVVATATSGHSSGFHSEPEADMGFVLNDIYCNDGGYLFFTHGYGTVDNLNFLAGETNYVSFSFDSDVGMAITNSIIYCDPNSSGAYPGKMSCTNCQFIGHNPNNVEKYTTAVPVVTSAYLADHVLQWTFDTCTFESAGKHSSYCSYGFIQTGKMDWSTYPDNYLRFTDCTWDDSLDGGLLLNVLSSGSMKTTLTRPVFNCITGVVTGSHTSHAIYMKASYDSDGYGLWVEIDDPTWNCSGGKLMHVHGYGGVYYQTRSWLFFRNDSITSALNDTFLSVETGIVNHCIAPIDSHRIDTIVKGADTTVTFVTDHGLEVGDTIMFEGFHETDNADWFTNLAPAAAAPIFSVKTQPSAKVITLELDSSGYAANYDNTKDYARGYAYPSVRTITSTSATAPACAGFVGDRYDANGNYYRCTKSGIAGTATWAAE